MARMQQINFSDDATVRVDVFLAKTFPKHTRSRWQHLVKSGKVRVNEQVPSVAHKLKFGDSIVIDEPNEAASDVRLPLGSYTIHEDEYIVVIDKPVGALSTPRSPYEQESSIQSSFDNKTTDPLGGIVHRLDRATSGVMILAKDESTRIYIQKQFANRSIKKTYVALVSGRPKFEHFSIDKPIERNPKKPHLYKVGNSGKEATTNVRLLKQFTRTSLLELEPKTGRTHQLRVHLNSIQLPIVGDNMYGETKASRLMLHARSIAFSHPVRRSVEYAAEVPAEFKKIQNEQQ